MYPFLLPDVTPIFAAGRVCAHSFFDLIQLYFHQHPTALQFWFELTRCDQARIWDGSESLEAANMDLDVDQTYHSLQLESEALSNLEGEDEEEVVEVDWGVGYKTNGNNNGECTECRGGKAMKVVECGRCKPQPRKLREIVNDMRSVLDQIPVPRGFVRATYGALVHALLEHGILPMGLYRPAGVWESSLPFALINPQPDTILVALDLVYVLRPKHMRRRPRRWMD